MTLIKVKSRGTQNIGGGRRNLVINGAMQVAQRGTSKTGINSGTYAGPDRIQWTNGSLGTWTISQSTDVPAGEGFSNSWKVDCTTANGSLSASSHLQIQ